LKKNYRFIKEFEMAAEIDSKAVKDYGIEAGASVVGIAASKDFILAPEGFKPTDKMEGCLSVVVFGTPFPKNILPKTSAEYTELRKVMLEKMNSIAKNVAKHIKKNGYKAEAIGSISGKYVNGNLYGHISLKHAAELAGLGIIGRNYLLTNSEYGNLLWLSAVLTDADLVPDKKTKFKICDKCNKCVEKCPVKALDNPSSFGKKECGGHCFKQVNGKLVVNCYLCRKVCLKK